MPKKQPPNGKCSQCGKEMHLSPSRLKSKNNFCNTRCYALWISKNKTGKDSPLYSKVETTCFTCGKTILRARWEMERRERQFCSKDCFYKQHAIDMANSNNPFWKPEVEVTCQFCGKVIKRAKSEVWEGKLSFCSQKCKWEWQRINWKGENNNNWKDRPSVQCANCGKEMIRYPFDIERSENLFCGIKCAGEWKSKHWTGENCPGWKGGKIRYYGPNWRKQKRAALKRDKHTCQHCGYVQKEGRRPYLEVHHIVPFRTFNYIPLQNNNYKLANTLTNLITLCTHCHRKAEFNQISFQPRLL